eukprot:349595-Chlamydomonas_euryale.AAC.2
MSPPSDMAVTLSSSGTARAGSAPEVERHSPQQRRVAQAAPPSYLGVATAPSATTPTAAAAVRPTSTCKLCRKPFGTCGRSSVDCSQPACPKGVHTHCVSPCRAGAGWFCVQHGKAVPATAPPLGRWCETALGCLQTRFECVCGDEVWLLALLSLRALASYASGRSV